MTIDATNNKMIPTRFSGDWQQDVKDRASDIGPVKNTTANFKNDKSKGPGLAEAAVISVLAQTGLTKGVNRLCQDGENSLLVKITNSKIFDNKIFGSIDSCANSVAGFISRSTLGKQIIDGLKYGRDHLFSNNPPNTKQALLKDVILRDSKLAATKLQIFEMGGKFVPKAVRKFVIGAGEYLGAVGLNTLFFVGPPIYNAIKAPSDKIKTFIEDALIGTGAFVLSNVIMGEIAKGAGGLAKEINPKDLHWALKAPAWLMKKFATVLGAGIKGPPPIKKATEEAAKESLKFLPRLIQWGKNLLPSLFQWIKRIPANAPGAFGGIVRLLIFFYVMKTCSSLLTKVSRKIFGAPQYRIENEKKEKAAKEAAKAKEKAEKEKTTKANAANPFPQNTPAQIPAAPAQNPQNVATQTQSQTQPAKTPAIPFKTNNNPLENANSMIKQFSTQTNANAKVGLDGINLPVGQAGQPKRSQDLSQRAKLTSDEPYKRQNPMETLKEIDNNMDERQQVLEEIKKIREEN